MKRTLKTMKNVRINKTRCRENETQNTYVKGDKMFEEKKERFSILDPSEKESVSQQQTTVKL